MFFWLYVLLFAAPALVVGGYYLFWAMLAWWPSPFGRSAQQCPKVSERMPARRLLLLVPAHNEQSVLPALLRSIEEIDYPDELYRVVVIADHCTDQTAEVARAAGVECLCRDAGPRTKAGALHWALERLCSNTNANRNDDWDALVVVDADCRIDGGALRRTDGYLAAGFPALQWTHRVINCDRSPISYALTVGRRLEYELFFAPKSACGAPAALVGTGMVLRRDLAEQLVWETQSAAEDTEYTLQLAEQAVKVRFAPDAALEIHLPETFDQLRVQRTRWARGNLHRPSRIWQRAIRAARQNRIFWPLDLAWSLTTRSRPLSLGHLAVTVALAVTLAMWQENRTAAILGAAAVLTQGATYLLGVLHVGITGRRLLLLASAPKVVAALLQNTLGGLLSPRNDRWEKTPRPESQHAGSRSCCCQDAGHRTAVPPQQTPNR